MSGDGSRSIADARRSAQTIGLASDSTRALIAHLAAQHHLEGNVPWAPSPPPPAARRLATSS